ncbi:GspE/PulE family protein [Patescibacteria group bacterium]
MPQDLQSIEDLISSSNDGPSDDESVHGKFVKKQQEIKIKEMERQTKQKAADMGVPYIDLFGFPISPEALVLVKENDAERLRAVCFFYDGDHIRIASTNPKNEEIIEIMKKLEEELHTQGKIYLISDHSYDYCLRLYKNLPKVRKFISGVEVREEDLKKFEAEIKDYRSLSEKINKVNISDIVTLLLATAMKTRASDIHIEAEEKGIVIRYRIDGVLQEAAMIKKEQWKKVISRMKLLARVKINITDKPQDGRFTIFLTNDKIDVRSSFLPTAYGESVVMRLLRSESIKLPFEELGISPSAFEVLKKEIIKPNGLILTTGPTGSGKTTTLYAVLNKLNTEDTKIITLEDPIEYKLEGINQSQVDQSKDYTFAKGLRTILRQDPDIVMVGEIRDLETAEIAIQASLTGHLVLSTLHTNDSSGVIPRLVDMGVKPYFLVPSINAVIGQRLVRRLCKKCKTEHKLSEEEEEQVMKILSVVSPKAGVDIPTILPTIYKAGKGCDNCAGIGYRGRIGIYELFTMKDNLKDLASQGAPAFKILQLAIENGMVTMLQDGVLKAIEGRTSLAEVYRVIGKFEYIDTLYDIVISQTIGRGIKVKDEQMKKGEELAKDLTQVHDEIAKIPIKEMIHIILATAIKSDTGDIHIEPTEAGVDIRFRIDGILHDAVSLTKEHYLQLLSNIKILAGFPTNVKKATWDGRFGIVFENQRTDCRISIISGGYGETVVIRLLTSQASALKMDKLGIRPYALNPLMKSMKKTKGIIVTTGPTGSGKTTTLYSVLNHLNNPDIKIITIEDPIEYHMDGIIQTQINVDEGYTFSAAIRSLMRQNPNIVMVGEIRDAETAKIAIEASMTGHLVLSTIHANSAAGAIPRFVGLGVDRQMLASSIEASIGQRLVRRICEQCKKEIKLEPELLSEVKEILNTISPKAGIKIPEIFKFFKGDGCEACSGIGYKGRIGIYEVIEMTPEMQKLIQAATVTDHDVEQEALKNGTILVIQDGILKAIEGETTVEEVLRVGK